MSEWTLPRWQLGHVLYQAGWTVGSPEAEVLFGWHPQLPVILSPSVNRHKARDKRQHFLGDALESSPKKLGSVWSESRYLVG